MNNLTTLNEYSANGNKEDVKRASVYNVLQIRPDMRAVEKVSLAAKMSAFKLASS